MPWLVGWRPSLLGCTVMATRVEAIARVDAMASRVEAIAIRLN